MPTFTDNKGRAWEVRLTLGLLTEVREQAGVKLGEVLRTEQGLADFVFGDVETLGKVLWVLCREQAERQGVTPEDFAHGFGGDTIEKAVEAVLGSVADFFPRSKIGAAIRKNLALVLAKADERGVAALEKAAREAT